MVKRAISLLLCIACLGGVFGVNSVAAQATDRHYYKVFNVGGGTWEEANAFCQSIGGYLLTVNSEDEQDGVEELLDAVGSLNCYWMGGRLVNGAWTWVTGEPFSYTEWAIGEPNNENGAEGYTQILANRYWAMGAGSWNDASADGAGYANEFFDKSNTGFICEWDYEPYYGIPYGDINCDGVINSIDAAAALRVDTGITVPDLGQRIRGDVSGDGTVNSLDAANILKYDAGIIDSFRAEG